MGTRSIISKGKKSIYCHWDGYPSHNGKILLEFYNTDESIDELLSLGNISSLCKRVKPDENETHSFDSPIKDVTVAYHRDRNEPLAFWGEGSGEEYIYLFHESEWYFKSCYSDDDNYYYNLEDYFKNIDDEDEDNLGISNNDNIRKIPYPYKS